MLSTYTCLIFLIVVGISCYAENNYSERENTGLRRVLQTLRSKRQDACPEPAMCKSQWGYCGTSSDFCGDGCTEGPCWNTVPEQPDVGGDNGDENIINYDNFACVFNTIDDETRVGRFNGLKRSGWNPMNHDEAAVFLAHVFHETDGLKTMREYCAPG
jgi:hypothetical protein